jgi:hypothetical protein
MVHIDIAAHRPHPYGYLGYVLVARGLDWLIHDPNTSLVLWNVAVTAVSAVVLLRLAWIGEEPDRYQALRTAAAAAIFVTSPLVWFYSEVAEIYPSEMMVVLLIAYTAWGALRRARSNIFWCAAAVALAVVFKATAALLMLPLVAYAWTQMPAWHRRWSAVLLAILVGVAAAGFLIVQPNLLSVVWQHFVSTTASSRLIGGQTCVLKALNRNLRDTLTALISGFGAINFVALCAWALFDRRLPSALDRRFSSLWALPWIVLVVAVHIGKAGYVLPFLPLGFLIVAAFYARQAPLTAVTLIGLQLIVNVAQFVWLPSPSPSTSGASMLYRDKTRLARLVSDLQNVTVPTARTIAESDRHVVQLLDLVASTCPSGEAIVVAGATVDYRRVMWYLPKARAIDVMDTQVLFVGNQTNSVSVTETGVSLSTVCPIVWLAGDDGKPTPFTPHHVTAIPSLGWMSDPDTLMVRPSSIRLLSGG